MGCVGLSLAMAAFLSPFNRFSINPPPAGLPIRPIFSRPLPHRRALKRRLGLDPGLPAVLLVGGGEGMGALEETVVQLDKQLGDAAQVGRARVWGLDAG